MRNSIPFRNQSENNPKIFNPRESTFNSSSFPLIIKKGSGEPKSIAALFIQVNSTANKDLSEKYLTQQIHNETSYIDDNAFLARTFQSLDSLNQLSPNWDGYNAERPNIKAIEQTKFFFIFFKEIFSLLPDTLSNPNITANSEGDIVLEWWFLDKKLTLYIMPTQISYIKVAGERIEDMEDGLLRPQDNNQLANLFFLAYLVVMIANGVLEELVNSEVTDCEFLYRSIKKNEAGGPEFYRYVDQKLRISSSAFNDRSQQPSVDRAILQNADPTKSKKSPSDGIVALLTKNIREEKIDIMNHNGRTIDTTYAMDVKPDPINNPPEINLAHALIIPSPDYKTKNAFNKIKERLAILASKHGWVIKPG